MGQPAQEISCLCRTLNQIRSLHDPPLKAWKTTLRQMLNSRIREHSKLISPNLSRRSYNIRNQTINKDKRSHSHPIRISSCISTSLLYKLHPNLSTYEKNQLCPKCTLKNPSNSSEQATTINSKCPKRL